MFHSVFPTPVGVFPLSTRKGCTLKSLPHARGGVSLGNRLLPALSRSSPRPWGCFHSTLLDMYCAEVFPTPVGVFPVVCIRRRARRRLPHARGGVSSQFVYGSPTVRSSPRPWGCFLFIWRFFYGSLVFPTPVGVFLAVHKAEHLHLSLPHARGGVSEWFRNQDTDDPSSPRPWGCF